MIRTDTVVASSRYVRIAVATCLATALPMILGFQVFASQLGQSTRDVLIASECRGEGCVLSPQVVRAVDDLEDRGMTCRAKPALTDSIVFEWLHGKVEVINFGAALDASSNSEGWVRRYCLPPQ